MERRIHIAKEKNINLAMYRGIASIVEKSENVKFWQNLPVQWFLLTIPKTDRCGMQRGPVYLTVCSIIQHLT